MNAPIEVHQGGAPWLLVKGVMERVGKGGKSVKFEDTTQKKGATNANTSHRATQTAHQGFSLRVP
jgi:hypothetical protein